MKIAGVCCSREDDESDAGKSAKHSLAVVPFQLEPEDLGFVVGTNGAPGILKKSPKKRGRPHGSRNKKKI